MTKPGLRAREWFHYFSFEAVNSENMLLKIDRIRLNARAHQNPSTLNPGTMLSTNNMIKALITSKKNPKRKDGDGNCQYYQDWFDKNISQRNQQRR